MKEFHYLDHAATTPVKAEVIAVMQAELANVYGNPSATHQLGREARKSVESSRKSMAQQLGVQASELVFVSNATEANNWILTGAVKQYGIQRIITTELEHHAVLDVVKFLGASGEIEIVYLSITEQGEINLTDLNNLLSDSNKVTLVTLMQVNNEVGVLLDTAGAIEICQRHQAFFHCDTVQGIGKIDFPLGVDFAVGSAHKFNGPKGCGFAYIKKGKVLPSWTLGGAQEKGWRAGTEATHQIAGMAKALELAQADRDFQREKHRELRAYLIAQLREHFPQTRIYSEHAPSLESIVNFALPWPSSKAGMLAFQLDMKGIGISRGSACQSGSSKPSHVLQAMVGNEQAQQPNIRVSFGYNTEMADIDALIVALQSLN